MEKQEKNTVTPYDLDGEPAAETGDPPWSATCSAMFVGNLTPLLIITAACQIKPEEAAVALLPECHAYCRYRRHWYRCLLLDLSVVNFDHYGNQLRFHWSMSRALPELWEMV